MAQLSATLSVELTSVITGAQESSFHCEAHSCCLEQIPEHQPHFMKSGAIKHTEHVIKWAHPGPAEGTLNIWNMANIVFIKHLSKLKLQSGSQNKR